MDRNAAAWVNGLLGMLIFSGSLPATRLAVVSLDPMFVTVARASIAGLLGLGMLLAARERRPAREDLVPLLVVALGVVIGFPLLTAVALREVTSAHAIGFIGLLPLSTACFAVLRGGERPRPAFWAFSLVGAAIVTLYALSQGAEGTPTADGAMLAAILVCGLGYAEGARLSRKLGGWQVICWALVLSLPLMLPLTILFRPATLSGIGWPALAGFAYVSLFSMLIGFIFWYRGLALGGTATVGQLQLLQPFFGLLLASLVLGETIGWPVVAVAAAVALCVAGGRRFA